MIILLQQLTQLTQLTGYTMTSFICFYNISHIIRGIIFDSFFDISAGEILAHFALNRDFIPF